MVEEAAELQVSAAVVVVLDLLVEVVMGVHHLVVVEVLVVAVHLQKYVLM